MNFHVSCECGRRMSVSEASAGARLSCSCGREVRVPALHELRTSIGLPPYPLSPELEIDHMLNRGGFPPRGPCARCTGETDAVTEVIVRYGERPAEGTEADAMRPVIAFLLFGWLGLLFARNRPTTFDKEYRLPLHLCPACRPRVSGRRAVRQCLTRVDLYERLLEKHPYAAVELV